MDTNNTLQIWAIVTLVIRTIAVAGLIYVARMQYLLFKFKEETFIGETRLKWLFFSMVLLIAGSNIPIGYLSLLRATNQVAPDYITAWATITNGLAMLLVAILLILIYRKD
jgi:E3 ubiquitin-protein ligase DOA10